MLKGWWKGRTVTYIYLGHTRQRILDTPWHIFHNCSTVDQSASYWSFDWVCPIDNGSQSIFQPTNITNLRSLPKRPESLRLGLVDMRLPNF